MREGLIWIAGQFGWSRAATGPVTPTKKFFPTDWTGTGEEVGELFDRLCRYMDVDPARIALEYYSEEENPLLHHLPAYQGQHQGSAGLYFQNKSRKKLVIGLNVELLDDAPALVGTISHELAHVHLLGDGRLSSAQEDHERLTDLLTVFLGLGIFTANAAFRFNQWQDGQMQGWSTQRAGYLSEPEWGYALACYAWVRGEASPAWAEHLVDGVRLPLRESLRYFEQNGPGLKRGAAGAL